MEEIIVWLEENINLAVQFLLSGGLFTWVAALYSKFKSQTIKTPESIAAAVESKIKSTVDSSLKSQLDKVMDSQKVLAESMVLLSQNDGQAKLALIENMKKLNVDTAILQEAEKIVKEEIVEETKQQEAVEEAIEELEKPVEFL
jgi:hypothetical protein